MSKKIKLLCAENDKPALTELTEALGQKGVRLTAAAPGKNDTVLAVLSEAFYADKDKTYALLSLIAAGAEHVLPLRLDETPVPDRIKNALYARNILPAGGRDAAQLAERIAAAIPAKKNRLPWWLTLGGAAALAVIGALIWQSRPAPEPTPEAVPAIAEPTEYTFYIPNGWTEDELKKIVAVVITGDGMAFYTAGDVDSGVFPDWDDAAYRSWDDDGPHYYSKEDGHEYAMKRYEDLRFLELMPNLRALSLTLVECRQLPSLRLLTKLDSLTLNSCRLPDMDWAAEASPRKLTLSVLTAGDDPQAAELSGLGSCAGLRTVYLDHTAAADLSLLAGAGELRELYLTGLAPLRDVSALGDKDKLQLLSIQDCPGVSDLSPIAGCTALERFYLTADEGSPLRDAAFLSDLPKLRTIHLAAAELPDLEFLRPIGARGQWLDLELRGAAPDYSALAAAEGYTRLLLGGDGRVAAEAVLPWLQDTAIGNLCLSDFPDLDLGALPQVTGRLELQNCDLTDLSALPGDWTGTQLALRDCPRLRSLDGLPDQVRLEGLEIYNCPRLTDWSALDGMQLTELAIVGGFTVPSLGNVRVGTLRLEGVAELSDLSFLDGMDTVYKHSFALVGLDFLRDISALGRFEGDSLTVSPQLQEQAQDLVNAGNFRNLYIEYPQGGWDAEAQTYELLSLSELGTLPPALLRRIDTLCVTGEADGREDAIPGRIGDIRELSALTGLRRLRLYGQPLRTLDGIQALSELEEVSLRGCESLTDAAALFALPGLREADLSRTSVDSVQGAQNLTELERLDLAHTAVRDLTPLLALEALETVCVSADMTEAVESLRGREAGFTLQISES